MKMIDISWPITPTMTAYKNKNIVEFHALKTFDHDGVRESTIRLGAHTGTHIDAPAHFLQGGCTINEVLLTSMNGPCTVLDLTECEEFIDEEHVRKHTVASGDIILLKTRNSFLQSNESFNANFIYVHARAANYLAQLNIQAVGIDYLGIERNQPKHDTHDIFMRHHITIIEGLRLQHVMPGKYILCCLPLALQGLEASPARAVLLQLN